MLTLQVLDGEFTIHRLDPKGAIPPQVIESDFFTVSKTPDELSIVCRAEVEIAADKSSGGWACFKVPGPLDFSLTGILAGIAGALAEAGISLFAVSTYDTDYILVKAGEIESAAQTLATAGYNVV
ncbi:MAG: ACT domain-containing protein [Chloroflexota bacterium]